MKAKDVIRFCTDIGLFTMDRSPISCKWRTIYCSKHCYNNKLYCAFAKGMRAKDARNDAYWDNYFYGKDIAGALDRKHKPTKRFRLMTRGEAISTTEDIPKIIDLLKTNRDRLIMIPTRAWRNATLRQLVRIIGKAFKNVRFLASIDPSNTGEEINGLIDEGWSTIFFGDDSRVYGRFQCPKTWKHKKGHCSVCRKGCFSKDRVDIHLKQH